MQTLAHSARHLILALMLFGAAVIASTDEVEASTGTIVKGEFKTAFGTHRAYAVVAPPVAEPGVQVSWSLVMAAVAAGGLLRWKRS